jgi:multidrug efflux pump subunit AcrA (membrane-fusion protein)
MRRAIIIIVVAIALGWALVRAYRGHQQRVQEAKAASEPVIAPTRLTGEAGEVGVTLDSAGMANSALRLAAVRPATAAQTMALSAVVVADPEGMSVVRSPLSGRLAVAPGRTWPAFGDLLREGDEIATVADARPLAVPRTGRVTRVLARPGEMVQAGDVLLELSDYTHPVVSVAWVDGAPPEPPAAVVIRGGPGDAVHPASLLGPAPDADPLTHRGAVLYRVAAPWPSARPGLLVVAEVPAGSAAVRGVLVPSHAVVQWDGLTWAWLRRGPAHFVRVRVPDDYPVANGWLVTSGLVAGDSIVVVGAQQLLSEEFRARITVGDEVAE